jgi:hypothetical protein
MERGADSHNPVDSGVRLLKHVHISNGEGTAGNPLTAE